MKKAAFLGMAIYAAIALVPSASALPVDENAEAKAPENGWWSGVNETTSPGSTIHRIRTAYHTPICEEWPYVDENSQSLEHPKGNCLDVHGGTPLSEALDGIAAQSAGMLRWERNNGSLCVVATGKGAKVENCLDTRIDLHVEKLSAWDALCAVAKAANEKPVNGRRIGIYPGFIQMRRYPTPKGLKDTPCITLDLKDVPARDAICAIIAQAPLRMSYRCYNEQGMGEAPPVAKLIVKIFGDDGKPYSGPRDLSSQEYYGYLADYYEMVGDEKQAADNARLSEGGDELDAEAQELRDYQDEKNRASIEQQQAQEEAQKEEAQEEAQ